MKNIKRKLIAIMISTTLLLFLITFWAIHFYQKNYIFDKASLALENELINLQEANLEYYDNENRLFDIDFLFLDEYTIDNKNNYAMFNSKEKFFINLFLDAKLNYKQTQKINTEFGEYYILLADIPEYIFYDEQNFNITTSNAQEQVIPILLYADITTASNVVNRLNLVFFIMLFIIVIVEGIAGFYLGTKLENNQKKLKHFFENASHELKTPLMSIQGYAEGIKTGVIDDNQMASDIIIKQSNKMKLLVDEILNISKLDSGEYTLKKEIINIRDMLEESVESFQLFAEEKQIEIELLIDEENTEIKADALQIYKALNTIIDNAFKFAKNIVRIKTFADKSYMYIEIYNSGSIIGKEKLEHIFDRFYSNNDLSTGIGLAMAKEIITLSKGNLTVKNANDGVVFTVKLPKK